MALVAVLPIPAELPAVANGAAFGPVVGTVITWTGAMTGALLSYEIARRWGRAFAARFVSETALGRVDAVLDGIGPWGLLLARFTPVVAFTALNWGAGLARVSRARFAWTTAIGILPGAIAFTASGTGLAMLIRRLGMPGAIVASVILAAIVAWSILRLRRGVLKGASPRPVPRTPEGWPERRISGFHEDEVGDWVADLECGHTRHVRHDPPWQKRPWVTSDEGRRAHIGRRLGCRRCAEEEGP